LKERMQAHQLFAEIPEWVRSFWSEIRTMLFLLYQLLRNVLKLKIVILAVMFYI